MNNEDKLHFHRQRLMATEPPLSYPQPFLQAVFETAARIVYGEDVLQDIHVRRREHANLEAELRTGDVWIDWEPIVDPLLLDAATAVLRHQYRHDAELNPSYAKCNPGWWYLPDQEQRMAAARRAYRDPTTIDSVLEMKVTGYKHGRFPPTTGNTEPRRF